ncbi:YueI family protein [Aquibacillus albus]|uniref:Uncharacterized protein YueI n=1 Tax=Aquibacillus albus TaxID=1168171 RepID=A0ABS2MZA4_9BACI|nr:YueI family protein [Aquibacillus albus]MBM7571197.1 uncharacterized protein YueI [Aquibacillus albus]
MKKDVGDYLQEGIYGAKEVNPSERKLYLGSLRERVILALTKGQVMKSKGLKELNQCMRENKRAKILFNGSIHFRYFKKYKKLANKHNIRYTSVDNNNAYSKYGLIFTYDHAIDKENILLEETNHSGFDKKEKTPFFKRFFQWK